MATRQRQRRRTVHPRRLALSAALFAAAVLLGGVGGVLIGFTAVLLYLDAVLPVPGRGRTQADERFDRLVRQRTRAALLRRTAPLEILDEEHGWVPVARRRPLGVMPIPLDAIVATTEPARARAFDRALRPHPSEAQRWRGLWLLMSSGEPVPPIEVYRIGATFVLRDGHHRASVARDLDWETIDADVVELLAG